MGENINTSITLSYDTYEKYQKWRKLLSSGERAIGAAFNALNSLTAFEQKNIVENGCLPQQEEYIKEVKALLARVEARYRDS